MCRRPEIVPPLTALLLFLALGCFLTVCTACGPLPNPPPCTGREVWPDPCAAHVRDAGGDR